MAYEPLRHSDLLRAVPVLLADLSDLIQKELRLARAEINRGLKGGIRAGIWMAVAALFALVAIGLIAEGLVFAIANTGLAMHWSCFLVALLFAALGGAAVLLGRNSVSGEDLAATRTVRQLNRTIKTAKEQLI
jgi:hypothetical protein